ncbi:hypothetical protein BLAT2472_20748 [Burkholderia latens]
MQEGFASERCTNGCIRSERNDAYRWRSDGLFDNGAGTHLPRTPLEHTNGDIRTPAGTAACPPRMARADRRVLDEL